MVGWPAVRGVARGQGPRLGRVILSTERLDLRRLRGDDVDALHRALGDPVSMAAYEHGFSRDETQDWITRQQQHYERDGFGLWAVMLRESGEVIGDCGITTQHIEDDTVLEVGYHLDPAHQGRGYAVEAARACRDWAFTQLDADRVWAKVRDTNLGSMNVAIRLGMLVRRRFVVEYRGVSMPHLGFAITRDEWSRLA